MESDLYEHKKMQLTEHTQGTNTQACTHTITFTIISPHQFVQKYIQLLGTSI